MGRPRLALHPLPPPDLHARSLPLRQTRSPWVRLHECSLNAGFFGRTGENRFDAPNGEYGVLYAGEDTFAAFVESFGDPLDVRVVSLYALARKCLSRILTGRILRLVDLSGGDLRRIHANARLTTGPHELSQQWSLAFWSHPDRPDGIIYRARHDPSKEAVAIFDRAQEVVKAASIGALAEDHGLLSEILEHYGFGLVD